VKRNFLDRRRELRARIAVQREAYLGLLDESAGAIFARIGRAVPGRAGGMLAQTLLGLPYLRFGLRLADLARTVLAARRGGIEPPQRPGRREPCLPPGMGRER